MSEKIIDFEKYEHSDDPEIRERSLNWSIAIGLQKVDGLTVSNYLLELAKQNIEGKITIREVNERLDEYYRLKHANNEGPAEDSSGYDTGYKVVKDV